MKNGVEWNGYTIYRWVAVFVDGRIIDELDNMKEAKKKYAGIPCGYKYAAAEAINEDGDVNPAVYGNTLKEAMEKIKKVLIKK